MARKHKVALINWNEISELDIAYMAGIVDGDGCICQRKTGSYGYYSLTINNTSKPLMDWIEDKFGAGGVNKERRTRPANHKRVYTYLVAAQKELFEMIKRFEPYLIVKKDKARECLEFLEEKFG